MVYTNIYNNLNVCVHLNSYLIVQCEQCLCLTLFEQRVSLGNVRYWFKDTDTNRYFCVNNFTKALSVSHS